MKPISRSELRDKINHDNSIVLIDVLDRESYRDYHLPDAINVPHTKEDFIHQVELSVPNKNTPIVVYCSNHECQAAYIAANRLESAGFRKIYEYEAGKVDWKAAGLPIESEYGKT